MDTDTYWQLVEDARARARGTQAPEVPLDADDVAAALTDLLVERGPEVTLEADAAYDQVVAGAYGNRLWGAAYLIGGGCSDDGFDYFLGWLVAQGRAVLEAAVADPDSLADVVDADTEAESEDMLAAAWDAYERLTGEEPPTAEEDPTDDDPTSAGAAAPEDPDTPADDEWDFDDDDEMRARYPRLAALFLDA
ncbi:DUF4240 domain-containing protein [Cellulomonas phragmiteti]|uniref:DUF4240 domain-containing protein n=1 Tax=Cellulomonas phragmiteti TaxID=478780 RepID=A0ABQ4DNZ7_9CELL|nr:DUF4240 domain-containing protein [Cellulomonas phragmiteti]GIG41074.1 hypothetical protein Cph01nite_28360 [Cellulomonas phragmiteti]